MWLVPLNTQRLNLLEEFWNKGYGRLLMDFALGELRRAGYREVIIWVLAENTRARLFYEKYGFTHDGAEKEISIGKTLIEIRYVMLFDSEQEDFNG